MLQGATSAKNGADETVNIMNDLIQEEGITHLGHDIHIERDSSMGNISQSQILTHQQHN